MNFNMDQNNSPQFDPIQKIPDLSPATSIDIYTVLTVLCAMKNRLGLEAMLDYIDRYLHIVNKNNPRLRGAVQRALTQISVEKIHRDAMRPDKE